jgi:hypothetical protein
MSSASEPAAVPPLQEEMQRSVVRTCSLTIKVGDAQKAERSVTNLVRAWRGFVEGSESTNLDSRNPSLTMVIRVPESRFDDAIEAFEKLGERVAKTVSGQDVTSQLVDMNARLRNLRAQEETYRQILRQARRVGEVLEIQQHISSIRGEIESMDAQAKSLRRLAALSSLTLTLEQRPSGPDAPQTSGWAEDAWANATKALMGAVRSLSTAVIWVFVYSPVWLPAGFIAVLAWRKALAR